MPAVAPGFAPKVWYLTKQAAKKLKKLPKLSYVTGISIRKKRKSLRLTQVDFAKLIGVSTVTISQWERQEQKRLKLQKSTKGLLQKIWFGGKS